jgi:hypothetical protein
MAPRVLRKLTSLGEEQRRRHRERLRAVLRRPNTTLRSASSSKLSARELRQAISLGSQMASSGALAMLAMKARQVAERDRRRPRLVWDRDRGYIE